MDDTDRATEREEKAREMALQYRKPELIACGACHNCGEPLRGGLLFCHTEEGDTGCRDDYELAQDAKRRNGR